MRPLNLPLGSHDRGGGRQIRTRMAAEGTERRPTLATTIVNDWPSPTVQLTGKLLPMETARSTPTGVGRGVTPGVGGVVGVANGVTVGWGAAVGVALAVPGGRGQGVSTSKGSAAEPGPRSTETVIVDGWLCVPSGR